jgi:hypothetical protein
MTVFILKGDAPMDIRQAVKRGLRHFEAEKLSYERETGIVTDDPAYRAWAEGWIADNQTNAANNQFNHRLAAYRAALARLAQYPLAQGRPEVWETPEPEFEGQEVEPVLVSPAIEALPAQIAQPIFDPESGAQIGTELVANPAIVQDEAERAVAAAVINATPAEVVAFEAAQ